MERADGMQCGQRPQYPAYSSEGQKRWTCSKLANAQQMHPKCTPQHLFLLLTRCKGLSVRMSCDLYSDCAVCEKHCRAFSST